MEGDFRSFAQKHKDAKIAIGMHRNADLDAFCSAYALSTIFPNSELVTPDEMAKPAKTLSSDLGIKVNEFRKLDKNKFDGLIIVDTGTYSMIKDALGWKVLCVIDHHHKAPESERIKAELEIVDSHSPSTSQMVAALIENPSKQAAFALAIGIVSDTARFKSGNRESFLQMERLMSICGKSYSEILAYAEPERESDEKVGVLESLAKANVLTYKNIVIATTVVKSNESDASSSLSEFADIAFAASWKASEKNSRVSARARKHVSIPLNEIMAAVAREFNASGGGHAKAAGANAKEKPEKVLERCVEMVKDALDAE